MKRFLVASVVLFPLALFAYVSPGKPTGFVNDFAHMLSPVTASTLEQNLRDFQASTGNEISVVTIDSLDGDVIENYAVKLFEEWGIGNKEKDTGALLLISKNDKEARIEVGYGLEPVLTDIESSHIISDILVPAFRQNNFDQGITDAVNEMMNDVRRGEGAPTRSTDTSISTGLLSRLFYPFVFFIMVLGSILGRSKSWWAGGVIGGIVGVLLGIFQGILFGILAGIIFIPLGLLFDFLVSKRVGNGKGPFPPFWFGGGGGFGGRGGGGFGGFGGGMSGGGGSSGKW